jgi:hypothetical protein
MGDSGNKVGNLRYGQWVAAILGIVTSLAGLAWTLCRWGVGETLCGVALILDIAAAACVVVLTLAVVTWALRKRGFTAVLSDAAPVFVVVGSVSVTLVALAGVAALLITCGIGNVINNAAGLCLLGYLLGKGLACWRATHPSRNMLTQPIPCNRGPRPPGPTAENCCRRSGPPVPPKGGCLLTSGSPQAEKGTSHDRGEG